MKADPGMRQAVGCSRTESGRERTRKLTLEGRRPSRENCRVGRHRRDSCRPATTKPRASWQGEPAGMHRGVGSGTHTAISCESRESPAGSVPLNLFETPGLPLPNSLRGSKQSSTAGRNDVACGCAAASGLLALRALLWVGLTDSLAPSARRGSRGWCRLDAFRRRR